jgi:arylformamidase
VSEPDYRAQFDATVTFSNGGGLTAHDFRVDVPHAAVSAAEVGALFVASLALLMVDRVEVTGLRVFPEQHKGTRGGPSDHTGPPARPRAWVELSHQIDTGMTTYPGLPAPEITPHLTREASRAVYGERRSSRSTGSAWSATPAPIWTAPITATPAAPTWPGSR